MTPPRSQSYFLVPQKPKISYNTLHFSVTNYIGLFISPSGISKIHCATTKTDMAERNISMDRESLQVFVQPYSCSICATLVTWGLLTNASRTRSTVSANRPRWPLCFAAHRQPLCWNFMYHSRIVLSVCGSVRYMIRHLCCTVTIDSVLANSKTPNAFLFTVNAIFCHNYPQAVEPASTPRPLVQKKNLERFSIFWYAPFCHVCLGCCAVEFGNPGGTYE